MLRWRPKAGDGYQRVFYLLSVSSTTPGRRSIRTWQLVWSAGLMFTSRSQTWQEERKKSKTHGIWCLWPLNWPSICFVQLRKRKFTRMRNANLDPKLSLLWGKGKRAWYRGWRRRLNVTGIRHITKQRLWWKPTSPILARIAISKIYYKWRVRNRCHVQRSTNLEVVVDKKVEFQQIKGPCSSVELLTNAVKTCRHYLVHAFLKYE